MPDGWTLGEEIAAPKATSEGLRVPKELWDAIGGQETDNGKHPNTWKFNVSRAIGPHQITEKTFKGVMPEGDITNPEHNKLASERYANQIWDKYPDPAKFAAAWFSGPRNVNPGEGDPWIHDVADPNGRKVSEYVPSVLKRMGKQSDAIKTTPPGNWTLGEEIDTRGPVSKFAGDTGALIAQGTVQGLASPVSALLNMFSAGKVDQGFETLTGRSLTDIVKDAAETYTSKLTPEMRAAQQKHFVSDKEGEFFGPAWTDWKSLYSNIVSNAPNAVASIVPVGMAFKGAAATAKAAALAKGVAPDVAEKIAGAAGTAAATRMGAISEGVLGGAQQADQARSEVLGLKDDVLFASPAAQALRAQAKGDDEIRQSLANKAGWIAAPIAGIADASLGSIVGRMFGKVFSGEMGRAKSAAVAALTEGGTEFPQGWIENLASNIGVKYGADTPKDLLEGNLESAVASAMAGVPTGAATGALGGGKSPPVNIKPQSSSPPAAETGPTPPPTPAAAPGVAPYEEQGKPVEGVFVDQQGNLTETPPNAPAAASGEPTVAPQPVAAPVAPPVQAPVERPPIAPEAPPPVEAPAPVEQGPVNEEPQLGKELVTIKTAGGLKADAMWAVVDAGDLHTSHFAMGDENPSYPQEFQNRDRSSKASLSQVRDIVQNFEPRDLVMDTPWASDGAPVVIQKGGQLYVVAGNGRTLALRSVYAEGRQKDYPQLVAQKAAQIGIDPQQLSGMKQPVLVRVITTPMNKEELQDFVADSQTRKTSSLGATEEAKNDAERIDDHMLQQFDVGDSGNVLATSNKGFVSAFVARNIPKNEQSTYFHPHTSTPNDALVGRIERAMFHRAYEQPSLTDLLTHKNENDVRTITQALMRAAPSFVTLRSLGPPAELDFGRFIAGAADLMRQAIAKNQSLDEIVAQQDMFQRDEGIDVLAQFFQKYRRSPAKLGDALADMADGVSRWIVEHNQGDMLGGRASKPTVSDLAKAAEQFIKGNQYAEEPKQLSISEAPKNPEGQRAAVDKGGDEPVVENRPRVSAGPAHPAEPASPSAAVPVRQEGQDRAGSVATPEQVYDESLRAFRDASKTFREAARKYRKREIDDAEFLAARRSFDQAQAVGDAAESAFIKAKDGEAKDGVKEARAATADNTAPAQIAAAPSQAQEKVPAAQPEKPAPLKLSASQLEKQSVIVSFYDRRIEQARKDNKPKLEAKLIGQRNDELSRWQESEKLTAIADMVDRELAAGRTVAVVANGIADTPSKALGTDIPALLDLMAQRLKAEKVAFVEATGTMSASARKAWESGAAKIMLLTPEAKAQDMMADTVIHADEVSFANGEEPVKAKALEPAKASFAAEDLKAALGERQASQRRDVQRVANEVTDKLGSPPIIVAQSVSELPKRLQISPDLRGVFDPLSGRVYLIADNLALEDVEKVVLHEMVTHFGLRNMLRTDELENVLSGVYESRKAQINAGLQKGGFLEGYNFDFRKREDQLDAAEELIANLAETNPQQSIVQKVFAAVRRALRKIGLVTEYSDADLVDLLTRSRLALRGYGLRTDSSGRPMAHTAWHGSPHDFDEFKLQHIGTGEGAAAYGWGLYFAGNQSVAKFYRDALSRVDRNTDLSKLSATKDGETLTGQDLLPEYFKPGRVVRAYAGFDEVVAFRPGKNAWDWGVTVKSVRDQFGKPANDYDSRPRTHHTSPEADTVKAVLEADGWKFNSGRLYKVDLVPAEEDYLDWDKPLSEQSDRVKLALWKTRQLQGKFKNGVPENWTGSEIYAALTRQPHSNEERASRYLNSIGIPGIRYLDQGSRGFAGRGVSYSVEKVGGKWAAVKSGMSTGPQHAYFNTEQQAKDWIEAHSAQHNYVIFDDSLVTVTAKASMSPNRRVREIYGIRNGKVEGHATRTGDAWTLRMLTPNMQGKSQVVQAADINEVRRIFNQNGLEFQVRPPDNMRVEGDTLFQPFDIPEYGARRAFAEEFVRLVQDRMRPLRQIEKAIKASGGRYEEFGPTGTYRAEERYHSIAADKLEISQHEYVEPIVQAMNEQGLDLKTVGEYLIARHAPERNAAIAEINPQRLAGSGMPTEDTVGADGKRIKGARTVQAELLAAHPQIEEIGKLVDELNRERLNVLEAKGLISKVMVATLRSKYKHYVPLRGREGELDDKFQPVGKGFNITWREWHRAFGRESMAPAEKVLPYTVAQLQTAIVRGEKNEVGQHFLRLIQGNPNPSLWEIDKVEFAPHLDRDTGEVVYSPDRYARFEDNVVSVKVNGDVHTITLNPDDPNAVKLANAMKSFGAATPAWTRFFASITRFIAMTNTALSPQFLVTNWIRDAQTMGINIGSEQGAKLVAETIKNLPMAFNGAWRGLRQKGKLDPATATKWETWFREYSESGGRVNFFGMKTVEEQAKAFNAELANLNPSMLRRVGYLAPKKLFDLIMQANGAVENATRLALYVAAREQGMGKNEAASLSRNATVDFHRKGELGTAIGSFYAFFNASVQGSARMILAIAGSKKLWLIAATIAAAGFFNDYWQRLAMGKDRDGRWRWDKIGAFQKERNMLFGTGEDSEPIKIPMPYGYNLFWVIGQAISAASNGEATAGESAGQIFKVAMDAMNPLGQGDGGLLQMLAPTVLDPVVQAATNKNFFGGPIQPDQPKFGPHVPDSTLFWRKTPPGYVAVSKVLNDLGGGDEAFPAKPALGFIPMDVSPNMLQHFVRSVVGQGGDFWVQMANFIRAEATGEEVSSRDVPFKRAFVVAQSDTEIHHRFYQDVEIAERVKKRYDLLAQSGDYDKMQKTLPQDMTALGFYGDAEKVVRTVSELHKAQRAIQKSTDLSEAERKEGSKKLDDAINEMQMDFTARFESAVGNAYR